MPRFRRSVRSGLVATVLPFLLLSVTQVARAQEKKDLPITDERVQAAIRKGVEFIWSKQNAEGHWETHTDAEFKKLHDPEKEKKSPSIEGPNRGGATALALLGLLNGGEEPSSEKFVKALKWLGDQPYEGTYMRGLRAALYAALDKKYYKALEADVKLLYNGVWDWGTYGYTPCVRKPGWKPGDKDYEGFQGDFSNTQYGILGVWAGSEASLEIPIKYWAMVQKGYIDGQNLDGGWSYETCPDHKWPGGKPTYPGSRDALTLGGIASLFLVWDKYYAAGDCDRPVDPDLVKALNKAIDWVGKKSAEKNGIALHEPYVLYALERAGVASGLKRFGNFDWSLEGTKAALSHQGPAGNWPTGHYIEAIGTAWTITFLTYGRAPVVFNKLAYGKAEDGWNARPRDLANVTRWMGKAFEKKFNWQIAAIDRPEDLQDAPILYITGKRAVKFTDEQKNNLKNFVLGGGMILAAPAGPPASAGKFVPSIQALVREWFPDREMVAVSPTDLLNTTPTKLKEPLPHLIGLHNGVRWQVVISQTDLSCPWQQLKVATEKNLFGLACNLYAYVSDHMNLKGRGQSYHVADAGNKPAKSLAVARWVWGPPGMADPEPAAWACQDVRLRNANVMGLAVQSTDLKQPLDPAAVPLLHVTGVAGIVADDQVKANLKTYLKGGGVLLADAAGGNERFGESFQKLMADLFGDNALAPARADLPFLPVATEDGKTWYRHRFGLPRTLRPIDLLTVQQDGRLCVLFLPYDLTAAMVGYPSLTPIGLTPESADRFVTAVLKWRAGLITAPPAAAVAPTSQAVKSGEN